VADAVDLRSDTFTKPTQGMRDAMAAAEVGDDVYGEDPSVNALEAEVAALFGHEAAMFCPTGTMANQIALQLVVPRGDELMCDADAHVVTYEHGATAMLGGISTRTWQACGADLDVEALATRIRPDGYGALPTRAIAIEQTHNLAGGAVFPLATLQRLRGLADDERIALHCDGARIWNAHIADGVPLPTYGALFETLSVCLSKGLGAPVGSLVISTAERIERARILRKRLGGGMRQAGVLAAAGSYALRHHLGRLADDHVRAARIVKGLTGLGVVDETRVRTNIVPLDLSRTGVDAVTLESTARAAGVMISVTGRRTVRLVTHLDLDDTGVDRAVDVLRGALAPAV
jgi:threonine aldolase